MSNYLAKKASSISASPTLEIDAKFKGMKAAGIDVIGFGAGEPDFETPDYIKEAAIRAIQDGVTRYTPASGTMELKQAICAKLKRDSGLDYEPADIVISNGAKHSLLNAFMAICDPGDEVIVPTPFWVSYPEMIKLADGVPVFLKTKEANGFQFTIEDLKAVCTDKTRAIVLNTPSNPTGMIYSRELLEQVAAFAVERGIYIISDEIYEKLIYDGKSHFSIASISEEVKKQTILINGVSKAYAMTGWRIGYTASERSVAKTMGNIQSHATSNPNSIAQAATVAALNGPQGEVEEMRRAFERRRNYMVERIQNMDLVSCLRPGGAFYVMMNIKGLLGKHYGDIEITDADVFCSLLLEHAKVALVPGTGFGAPKFVRWSYANSIENIKKGLDRLESFLAEIKE